MSSTKQSTSRALCISDLFAVALNAEIRLQLPESTRISAPFYRPPSAAPRRLEHAFRLSLSPNASGLVGAVEPGKTNHTMSGDAGMPESSTSVAASTHPDATPKPRAAPTPPSMRSMLEKVVVEEPVPAVPALLAWMSQRPFPTTNIEHTRRSLARLARPARPRPTLPSWDASSSSRSLGDPARLSSVADPTGLDSDAATLALTLARLWDAPRASHRRTEEELSPHIESSSPTAPTSPANPKSANPTRPRPTPKARLDAALRERGIRVVRRTQPVAPSAGSRANLFAPIFSGTPVPTEDLRTPQGTVLAAASDTFSSVLTAAPSDAAPPMTASAHRAIEFMATSQEAELQRRRAAAMKRARRPHPDPSDAAAEAAAESRAPATSPAPSLATAMRALSCLATRDDTPSSLAVAEPWSAVRSFTRTAAPTDVVSALRHSEALERRTVRTLLTVSLALEPITRRFRADRLRRFGTASKPETNAARAGEGATAGAKPRPRKRPRPADGEGKRQPRGSTAEERGEVGVEMGVGEGGKEGVEAEEGESRVEET